MTWNICSAMFFHKRLSAQIAELLGGLASRSIESCQVLTNRLKSDRMRDEVMPMEKEREVLTAEQAADYLQVDRETVYRYIRQGKLVASRLGRTYRIPKRSIDLFLWATRTREDVTLREFTGEEIAGFLEADALDEEAQEIAERFWQSASNTNAE
jgi:excisionase family DNA binding protein